jgi:hypothetical protein
VALPLPFRIHLRPAAATYYGLERTPPLPLWGDLVAAQAGREPVPLAALCILERLPEAGDDGTAVEIARLGPTRAFAAALDHGYFFAPHDAVRKRRMLLAYLDLVARVPVLEVRFRPGFGRLPALLDAIEEAVRGALLERT